MPTPTLAERITVLERFIPKRHETEFQKGVIRFDTAFNNRYLREYTDHDFPRNKADFAWHTSGISFYMHTTVSAALKALLRADDSLKAFIPKGRCLVEFSYPFHGEVVLEFRNIKTRSDMAEIVYWAYRALYRRDRGRKVEMHSNCVTDLNNIKPSDIAVWGHGIEDLTVHSVQLSKGSTGELAKYLKLPFFRADDVSS